MDEDERLARFLNRCHREYLHRRRVNRWLWGISDDSTDTETMVE